MTTVMDTNRDQVAVSALYTAATWHWAQLPGAELTTPPEAASVFRWVNAYLVAYRWLNPQVYSLPHQLLHRHTVLDRVLNDFLDDTAEVPEGHQVVEVASGFSPRGLAFTAARPVRYTEIDLPAMVQAKKQQLARSAAGQHARARQHWRLHEGDVTQLDFVATYAADATPPRTAVITEGLMMYFPRPAQLDIWHRIAACVARTNGLYAFDYIPLSEEPPRSLLGRWLHAFRVHVLRIRGDFAYDDRDRAAVVADLKSCGFTDVTVLETGAQARAWQLPQAEVPTHTLIFVCRTEVTP